MLYKTKQSKTTFCSMPQAASCVKQSVAARPVFWSEFSPWTLLMELLGSSYGNSLHSSCFSLPVLSWYFPQFLLFLDPSLEGHFGWKDDRRRLKMMRCFPSQPGKAITWIGAPGNGEGKHQPPGVQAQWAPFLSVTLYLSAAIVTCRSRGPL